jgi:hypothetical protein
MRLQQRMVMALHHAQNVLVQSLRATNQGAWSPPRARLFLDAADAQARALAQRVEGQAHMLAQLAAAVVQDGTRLLADVAVQEVAERPLADEADAGRVLLLGVGQADLFGNAAHLGLVQLAHGNMALDSWAWFRRCRNSSGPCWVQALEQLEQPVSGFWRTRA